MAKLISLPNGKYIKADTITSVGELWCDCGVWKYTISHVEYEALHYHTVNLPETFVKTEIQAFTKQREFVEAVNNNL